MKTPLYQVLFGMFPNAVRAIAEHSQFGSEKHNPGQELHWAFDKSTDHGGCLTRHLAAAGTTDPETGRSHTIAMAWRALAFLETELIQAGADPGFAVEFDTLKKIPAPERWVVEYQERLNQWVRSSIMDGEYPNRAEAEACIAAHVLLPRRDYRPKKIPAPAPERWIVEYQERLNQWVRSGVMDGEYPSRAEAEACIAAHTAGVRKVSLPRGANDYRTRKVSP